MPILAAAAAEANYHIYTDGEAMGREAVYDRNQSDGTGDSDSDVDWLRDRLVCMHGTK